MGAITRWALRIAATLLTLMGLVAVVAVLRGSFGTIEAKIIASAAILLVASAIAAVGLQARAAGAPGPLGAATAILAGVSAAFFVFLVWAAPVGEEWAPRGGAIAGIGAVATGLHSALAAWATELRWLTRGVIVLAYVAGLDAATIVIRDDATVAEARLLAAAAILIVLGVVLMPILARLRADRGAADHHA